MKNILTIIILFFLVTGINAQTAREYLSPVASPQASVSQNVAGGLATAGGLAAATGIGVAATPFLEGAAAAAEGISLGARGASAIADIAQP